MSVPFDHAGPEIAKKLRDWLMFSFKDRIWREVERKEFCFVFPDNFPEPIADFVGKSWMGEKRKNKRFRMWRSFSSFFVYYFVDDLDCFSATRFFHHSGISV